MASTQASAPGIGLSGALFLVFLVLKLTGVIAWSWWWVTAPLWIPVVFVTFLIAIVAITHTIKYRKRKK